MNYKNKKGIINKRKRKGMIKMKIFENEDYKYISDFIESKSYILGKNKEFNKYYMNLSKLIEELDQALEGEQKKNSMK